ncbi:hypothetical protein RhiirA1_484022, partial [Rhizophagus irregularis]
IQAAIAAVISITIGDSDQGRAVVQDLKQFIKTKQQNSQKIIIEKSKGVKNVSENPKSPNTVSNKLIDLLVSDVLQKNGVDLEKAKTKLSDDQKQSLKELVQDLSTQVNDFVKEANASKKKLNQDD